MEHLGRWLRVKDTQMQFLTVGLGWVGGFAVTGAFLSLLEGSDPSYTLFGLIGGGVVYAIVHFAFARKRFRPDLDPYRQDYVKGRLAEKLGANALPLEEAARNREETLLLTQHTAIPADLRDEIVRETDRRMAQAFDLSVGSPLEKGLSRAAAEDQVRQDLSWLAITREECEAITLPSPTPHELADDPLLRLRSLAKEREDAMAELRTS
ncbi:hypothetical protein EON79_07495 [bacterium]|nr:MAG: hypothetical protein EON79_07495 [bacterium]